MPMTTAHRADARRTPREASLWFVGALPPPLNGQSNCNGAMLDELVRRGAAVCLHDIGGTTKSKIVGVIRTAKALLTKGRRGDRAYLSVPGQAGVWLFVPLMLLLRLKGIEHWVHHHSFRPINRGPALSMRLLVAMGGRLQRHVLLSPEMRRRFAHLYLEGDPERATNLSNAYLFGPRLDALNRPLRPVTLGHMSVLTREKGVSYLLSLFAALTVSGRDLRLVIAGPCADAELADEITAAVAAGDGRVEYRGPVSGEEKERFFRDIDLFVLPTTLVDEAEPLVLLEAYGRGVDVLATDTGCIRDRIRTPKHLLTMDITEDLAVAEDRIKESMADWSATRRICVEHARGVKALADAEAEAFFPRILGSADHLPFAAGL